MKKIKAKETAHGLEKPLCQSDEGIASCCYTDHYIDGVTYRVWSVFEGRTDAETSLENLMLRSLQSGEEVAEVVDELEKMMDRKNQAAEGFGITM